MGDAVQVAVQDLLRDFREYPQRYFTEEDVRWRLMGRLNQLIRERGMEQAPIQDGQTSILHGEYPTPFRCKMAKATFAVAPPGSRAVRGHFDIVVLDPDSIRGCRFEVVRAQFYKVFLAQLPSLQMPFLDTVIELKLFRDLAHSNRTESARRQAEFAAQAVLKTVAALVAQIGYYAKPFARRGLVLLLDNSEFVATGDIAAARDTFLSTLTDCIEWKILPDSLTAFYVASGREQQFFGSVRLAGSRAASANMG